ncbi:MAG: terminase small subunit [Oscillospiraceae bacterium]|nr:terminase small subunit [Oscillospiraceae bacterium]
MNEETILEALKAIAFSDFTEYIWVEDGEVRVKDSRQLSPAQRAAIAGIKGSGKSVEIKLHDKQKALELLVKYLGLFETQPEDTGIRVELAGIPEEWAE